MKFVDIYTNRYYNYVISKRSEHVQKDYKLFRSMEREPTSKAYFFIPMLANSEFVELLKQANTDIRLIIRLVKIQTFTACITLIFTKSSNKENIQTKNVNSL